MKIPKRTVIRFSSPHLLRLVALILAAGAASATVARADSPTDTFSPNTSFFKTTNWSTGEAPTQGVTGLIADNPSDNPLGWNFNTNPGAQSIGDLDFTSGETDVVIGGYTTKSTSGAINLTLTGSTLNSQTNTILANSTGSSVLFENDIAPSGDDLAYTGLTTFTLGNTANVIQASSSSTIIIDNVVTGSGDGLTFLGGGKAGTTGGTLELGAGSANDVTGGVAANAPTPANGGAFSGTATVQSSDKNSFTGGLTIGDVGGTANAGVVKIDGANALPTTGTVTVNANSQLVLNGSATYGGTAQSLALNGTGTASTAGALTTTSGNSSTWQGTVNLASTSSVNVQGSGGKLNLSGQVSGGQLESVGAGTLTLSHANIYSGGTSLTNGSLVAANATALGTGSVAVSGGALSSSIATSTSIGGTLSLNSGSIALNSIALPTFALASGQNFTMGGGTLSLTDDAGVVGSIGGAAGSFSITGGTLNLNNSFTVPGAYAETYDILSGFNSGSVSDLTITNYDSTDYTAHVSNAGVLSFDAVPEPRTWALMGIGFLALAFHRVGRKSARI